MPGSFLWPQINEGMRRWSSTGFVLSRVEGLRSLIWIVGSATERMREVNEELQENLREVTEHQGRKNQRHCWNTAKWRELVHACCIAGITSVTYHSSSNTIQRASLSRDTVRIQRLPAEKGVCDLRLFHVCYGMSVVSQAMPTMRTKLHSKRHLFPID